MILKLKYYIMAGLSNTTDVSCIYLDYLKKLCGLFPLLYLLIIHMPFMYLFVLLRGGHIYIVQWIRKGGVALIYIRRPTNEKSPFLFL